MTGDNQWHLDKKVPISLIVTITLQFAAGVWFASKLDARVSNLESNKTEQKERDDRQDRAQADMVTLLRSDMQEIKARLDRLIERGRP